MSYNGSGVYTLPGAALANGDIVSATENNQFRNDVAAALNIAWTRDGQAPATANIPMGSHKLTGLAAGTGAGDSVRYEQLPGASNLLPVASGGTGSGTASGARTNLGVVIGTDVQAYAAELQGATQGGINGMKNRIINGAMMIDQRNAGASVTPTTDNSTFPVDRFVCRLSQASKFSAQQSTTAPAGFSNSLKITSLSAYTVGASEFFAISQNIEGFNTSDLAWGTANAKTVTLSFQVYSSLTGTFGGTIYNSNADTSYPFTYTVAAANTWTSISVTIPGPTTGSWLGGNVVGINVSFSLGAGSTASGTANTWASSLYRSATGATSVVGTNGATFYITGVQLEKGSTATSFDYRPYGTELALCQRYYWSITGGSTSYPAVGSGVTTATNIVRAYVKFPVSMRDYATIGYTGVITCSDGNTSATVSSISANGGGKDSSLVDFTCSTSPFGTLRGGAVYLSNATTNALYGSAEL